MESNTNSNNDNNTNDNNNSNNNDNNTRTYTNAADDITIATTSDTSVDLGPSEEVTRSRRRRKRYKLCKEYTGFFTRFLSLLVVAMIIIIPATLLLFGPSPFSSSWNDGQRFTVRSDMEDVQDYIIKNQYSSFKSIYTSVDTPQYKAAKFMTYERIPYDDDSFTSVAWKERYAVTVFYYALSGTSWKYHYKFVYPNRDVCKWYVFRSLASDTGTSSAVKFGITCGRGNYGSSGGYDPDEYHRVRRILLPDNDLKGTIPWRELSLLENLDFLALHINSEISGTLPEKEEYWPPSLALLELSYTSLEGTIPESISSVPLQMLSLGHNQLTGTLPSTLFTSSDRLVDLLLKKNYLTGTIPDRIKNTNLRYLYLEDNLFEQELTASSFSDFTTLIQLDLSDNPSLGGIVPIDAFLYSDDNDRIRNLEVLDLHGTNITAFPDTTSNVESNVTFLALHDNRNLRGTFPVNALLSMKNTLQHLDITSTSFVGDMPTSLGLVSELEYLFMADTDFTPGPIPMEYSSLTKLTDFSLKHSRRTGTLSSEIFEQMKSLILLDLDSNDFTGTLLSNDVMFPTSLEYLLLNRNNFTGEVPSSLFSLPKLKLLLLDENSFTGLNIPPDNMMTNELQYLFLQNNPLLLDDADISCGGKKKEKWEFDCTIRCPCCDCCHPTDQEQQKEKEFCEDNTVDWLAQYKDPYLFYQRLPYGDPYYLFYDLDIINATTTDDNEEP